MDNLKLSYELVEERENAAFLVLYANGHSCTCPYQPVIPVPDEQNRMVGGRVPCNSGCPLAEVEVEKVPSEEGTDEGKATADAYVFIIHCGHAPLRRTVSLRKFSTITIASAPVFQINHK